MTPDEQTRAMHNDLRRFSEGKIAAARRRHDEQRHDAPVVVDVPLAETPFPWKATLVTVAKVVALVVVIMVVLAWVAK